MDYKKKVGKVRERAKSFYKGLDPSHDFQHCLRVKNTSLKLAESCGADKLILELSAYLHDIGRSLEKDDSSVCHAEWGAEKTKEILEESGFSEKVVEKVSHCIYSHRYSRGLEPESIEAKVFSDADNLDALGAIGVSRVFSYGGSNGTPFKGDSSSLEHFEEKILELKDRMYTEKGLEMAEERTVFVERFLDRFNKEWDGKL